MYMPIVGLFSPTTESKLLGRNHLRLVTSQHLQYFEQCLEWIRYAVNIHEMNEQRKLI